ncbi:stage III sporulation protein AF [Clostridium sp. UBA6640]|uniref:stage III sporulation protein AF n=1 Tax=Clostridium sp. UBA6640 TaxID=1946370 RepID=UPI0025B7AFF0|nr:stage III sporulation protein AF [Clostridium sp. UBA6640]
MINSLNQWIINICTAVFFITAVQMILPDNKLKKYCKFALGLILVVIILNPIVKLLDSKADIHREIEDSAAYIFDQKYEVDYEKYRQANVENTIKNFEQNMEIQCTKDLQEKYGDKKFKTKVEASFIKESNGFQIDSIEIGLNDSSVKKVKKVEIGSDSVTVDKVQDPQDENALEIKRYISSKYSVSEEIIYVYRENS